MTDSPGDPGPLAGGDSPPERPPRRWPEVAVGSLGFLCDQSGNVALFRPTYNIPDRGWYLVGGGVEVAEDEDPEAALAREIYEETRLRRQARRLLVSEWVAADPVRRKPAGPNWVWDVEPLTAQEFRLVRLSEEHSSWKTVPLADIDAWTLPLLARRIRAAAEAKARGTTVYLPPLKD